MKQPFVGLPTEGEGCAFAADLDCAACGRLCTAHLLVDSDWGVVSLAACAAHAGIARAAGKLLAEHEYASSCATNDCWGPDPT